MSKEMLGGIGELTDEIRERYQKWLKDDDLLLFQAVHEVENEIRFEELAKLDLVDGKKELFGTLPPIHIYRAPYNMASDKAIEEDDFSPEIWSRIQTAFLKIKKSYSEALSTGKMDTRKPLDTFRKAWFEEDIKNFRAEEHPISIPEEFSEASCTVFGHICPVFFAAEALTESSESRRIGRRQIPFHVKMRIVRRDNYTCQHCNKHLQDNEVEFDHIIPVSKGGSSEEHNLRLTCFDCNRDKSDDYEP